MTILRSGTALYTALYIGVLTVTGNVISGVLALIDRAFSAKLARSGLGAV
jgi:hypothetical protein